MDVTLETLYRSSTLTPAFQSSRTNVVEHIKYIYEEGELDEAATCRKFRQVQKEGNRNTERECPATDFKNNREVFRPKRRKL